MKAAVRKSSAGRCCWVSPSVLLHPFAVRKLELGEVWQYLRTANYWWIIPGVVVYFCRRLGAHLALALSAAPDQARAPGAAVSGRLHRLFRQQRLSGAGRRGDPRRLCCAAMKASASALRWRRSSSSASSTAWSCCCLSSLPCPLSAPSTSRDTYRACSHLLQHALLARAGLLLLDGGRSATGRRALSLFRRPACARSASGRRSTASTSAS